MRLKKSKIFICVFFIWCVNTAYAQLLPIKINRIARFTTTEGSYMNIDVSPDGKTLVFDLLGNIYTLPSSGGKAKQITRGMALYARPTWSPDGKKLAYISDESGSPQ